MIPDLDRLEKKQLSYMVCTHLLDNHLDILAIKTLDLCLMVKQFYFVPLLHVFASFATARLMI